MSGEAIRIAMWSGPRNISTAMMRSFENRGDTFVSDEPFYAAYLAASGADHPMREESLASQPQDWRVVAKMLTGSVPNGRPIWYQKHMTHHMLPIFGRAWIVQCRNAFLIRAPEAVLASYIEKRANVTLDELGFVQQWELFEAEADRLGRAPPVIDAADVLADPRGILSSLCAALDIPFTEKMLRWPPGRRDTDGVWAPVWYDSVERSTGFTQAPKAQAKSLRDDLRPLAEMGQHYYERLSAYRLRAG